MKSLFLALALAVMPGLLLSYFAAYFTGGPVHAEQPRIVVMLTCDDIRMIAQWKSWEEMERRARAAGATDEQIGRAKRCLR
jgi:hypothetical protein